MSDEPAVDWAQLAIDFPDGLAVVDARGRFVQLNRAAARLCGRPAPDLLGVPAPFDLGQDHGGLVEDSAERVATWSPAPGVGRELAYRLRRLPSDPALTLVTFRDVTGERQQAAIAVDYATLLEHERAVARRDERQRLARDLHDSIVQQVFSIGMQAKSMEVLGRRGDTVPAEPVRRIAGEVGSLSGTVLADLRAMVHELRPSPAAEPGGLQDAIRALIDSTANRTGLRFSLALGGGLEQVDGEVAEDVYRIVAEAVHNVVKHANARTVGIRLVVSDDRISATVTDNGRGIQAANTRGGPNSGYGLRTMRERAQRWDGTLTVTPRRGGGTSVRLAVPLAVRGLPAADGRQWRPARAS